MDLLTQTQSAEFTGLSQRTLERHRCSGTGPKFVRLGRRVFYRRTDLETWIAACTFGSTSEADTKAGRPIDPEQNADRSGQRSENNSDRHPPSATTATRVEFSAQDGRKKIEKFPMECRPSSGSQHHGANTTPSSELAADGA